MSKEKQIEEMAKDLCTLNRECEDCPFQLKGIKCNPKRNAERFIAKGYRKQSENVIELPCNVGDTVYEINRYDFESCKHCGKNGDVCPHLYAEVGYGYECLNTKYGEKLLECSKIEAIKIQDLTYIFHRWFDFGKTVFFTKAEAEKALEERSEDDD